MRYSCGHVSTKKNVRGIKDAATSTPPQLRSSRYIRYRDNIGYPRYGERYDIGDNQYSSNNLSYCPINRILESITNLSMQTPGGRCICTRSWLTRAKHSWRKCRISAAITDTCTATTAGSVHTATVRYQDKPPHTHRRAEGSA